MNRKNFYTALGKHTQQQVDGQEAILDEAEKRGVSLVEAAREALGISPEELDDLWRFGVQQ